MLNNFIFIKLIHEKLKINLITKDIFINLE